MRFTLSGTAAENVGGPNGHGHPNPQQVWIYRSVVNPAWVGTTPPFGRYSRPATSEA